jgi:arylsulfatase A-like enzyme
VPNVVLLHTHDTGRYLEPYGHAVSTPNIREFAEESLRFRNAFTAAPTCSPSRAALATGECPHSNGMLGLAHRGFALDDPGDHVANHLRERGFETALCGLQHEAREGDDREGARSLGYRTFPADDWRAEHPDRAADLHRDRVAARAAAEFARSDPEGPFFLAVGLFHTHRDFPEDHDVDPDTVRPPDPIPDAPPIREETAGYHASAAVADDCVGTVLDGLREGGLLEDTLVIYTTDHGVAFKDMKCNLFDDGTGIAQIVRFPDGRRAGEATDALISNVDVFPTLCDFLGVEAPDRVEGTSFLPIADGEATSIREEVYGEVTYHAAYEPKRSIRTDRYKYVRRYGDFERYVLPNIDDGPHKEFLLERGLDERTRPREALYDLAHDPRERDNLADDPEYESVRADLADRLDGWMERTDDPLLDGPVSKPPGAKINPQDDVHPNDENFEAEGIR